MAKKMKRALMFWLTLCLALTMLPTVFAAAGDGWKTEGGSWKYYENGVPLTGVRWIEAEQNRYVFDSNGILQTGDAEDDVLMNGNLYYINPNKDTAKPATCYAVHNYTRIREAGVTYYNEDGITFTGWMNTADGGRMYQTLIRKEDIGAAKDLYIYVWRGQHLPEGRDPITGANIPAGWYLFGEDGVLVQKAGWHDSEDLCAYRTNEQGLILEKRPCETIENPLPDLDPEAMDIPAIIEAANAYAYSRNLGVNERLAIGNCGFDNPVNISILGHRAIMDDLVYCIDQIAKRVGEETLAQWDHIPVYKIVWLGERIYVLYG